MCCRKCCVRQSVRGNQQSDYSYCLLLVNRLVGSRVSFVSLGELYVFCSQLVGYVSISVVFDKVLVVLNMHIIAIVMVN